MNYIEVKLRRWSRDESAGSTVRRLNDEKAVALGANFISENIVFTSACLVLFVEQWRTKKSSQSYKDDVQESITALKERVRLLEQHCHLPSPSDQQQTDSQAVTSSLLSLPTTSTTNQARFSQITLFDMIKQTYQKHLNHPTEKS